MTQVGRKLTYRLRSADCLFALRAREDGPSLAWAQVRQSEHSDLRMPHIGPPWPHFRARWLGDGYPRWPAGARFGAKRAGRAVGGSACRRWYGWRDLHAFGCPRGQPRSPSSWEFRLHALRPVRCPFFHRSLSSRKLRCRFHTASLCQWLPSSQ